MDDKQLDLIITDWKKRRLIKEITDLTLFKQIIHNQRQFYLGIDPTSDSLHIGHLVPIILAKELIALGCLAIILVGDSTSRIGDPSFRAKKRTLLNQETIVSNGQKIATQIQQLLPNAQIVFNSQWYRETALVDFLTEVGSLFTVNKILEKESFSAAFSRDALFYSDFSYILLQAYDFYQLWKSYNCYLQIGGSDQYPNIVFGNDLVRKLSKHQAKVCGVTTNLLLTSQGEKISKTFGEQIWLDLNKTSLYQSYQFFYNLDDLTALSWTKLFGFEDVAWSQTQSENKERVVQKQLFTKIGELVFGKDKLAWAQQCLNILENNNFSKVNLTKLESFLPSFQITFKTLLVWELIMLVCKLSKTKAIDLINHKAIKINQKTISDPDIVLTKNNLIAQRYLFVKKGKKELFLVICT